MEVFQAPVWCLEIRYDEEVDDDGDIFDSGQANLVYSEVFLGFFTLQHIGLLFQFFIKFHLKVHVSHTLALHDLRFNVIMLFVCLASLRASLIVENGEFGSATFH